MPGPAGHARPGMRRVVRRAGWGVVRRAGGVGRGVGRRTAGGRATITSSRRANGNSRDTPRIVLVRRAKHARWPVGAHHTPHAPQEHPSCGTAGTTRPTRLRSTRRVGLPAPTAPAASPATGLRRRTPPTPRHPAPRATPRPAPPRAPRHPAHPAPPRAPRHPAPPRAPRHPAPRATPPVVPRPTPRRPAAGPQRRATPSSRAAPATASATAGATRGSKTLGTM